MSQARAAVRGRRKPFNGVPARDVHMRMLGRACSACGKPALATLRVYAMLSDLRVDDLAAISVQHGGQVPVLDTKQGKAIRVSETFACPECLPTAERVAARAPSHYFVDVDRGPSSERCVL